MTGQFHNIMPISVDVLGNTSVATIPTLYDIVLKKIIRDTSSIKVMLLFLLVLVPVVSMRSPTKFNEIP